MQKSLLVLTVFTLLVSRSLLADNSLSNGQSAIMNLSYLSSSMVAATLTPTVSGKIYDGYGDNNQSRVSPK